MKSIQIRAKFCLFLGLWLLAFSVCANEIGGSVSALSGQSDNAFKLHDDTVSERQDEYRLNLKGNYASTYVKGDLEYKASDYRFADDSQQSEQFLEGNSSLLIGNSHQPAELLMTHSRKTLLSSPDKVDVINNKDEREIYALAPTLRANIGKSNHVFATGSILQIRYLTNELMDSSRRGATLGWARDISSIESFKVVVQKTDIEFDHFNGANYTYKLAQFTYLANLRHLTYILKVGENKSESEMGINFSSPAYGITATYKSALHEITLDVNKAMTDTSLGGGNLPSINESPNSDGTLPNIVDQIERVNTELRWATDIVCEVCNFYISAYQRDEDYLTLEQSAKSQGLAAGFSYRFSTAATLSVRSAKSHQAYVGMDLGKDYDLRLSSIEYAYKFVNGLGLRLIAQQEKRTSDVLAQRYRENYIAGGLDYSF